jgi:hypothetical protein
MSNSNRLASRFRLEKTSVKQQLENHLSSLAVEVARAQKSLEKDDPLNENLIVNAGSISGLIARWNSLYEHIPYLEDE